jgi:hypothetical protein
VLHRECYDKIEKLSMSRVYPNESNPMELSERGLFKAGIETAEYYDDESTLTEKVAMAAKLLAESQDQNLVAFTGAGISGSLEMILKLIVG